MVTVIFTVVVQIWKYRRDAFAARIDEFCKLIFETADLGAEYWVTKKPSKTMKSSLEARSKIVLIETKLNGYQSKIGLFAGIIISQIWLDAQDKLNNLTADFFDALTGSEFGDDARSANPQRAKLVYATGAEMVSHLRTITPKPSPITVLLSVIAIAVALYLLRQIFRS